MHLSRLIDLLPLVLERPGVNVESWLESCWDDGLAAAAGAAVHKDEQQHLNSFARVVVFRFAALVRQYEHLLRLVDALLLEDPILHPLDGVRRGNALDSVELP